MKRRTLKKRAARAARVRGINRKVIAGWAGRWSWYGVRANRAGLRWSFRAKTIDGRPAHEWAGVQAAAKALDEAGVHRG